MSYKTKSYNKFITTAATATLVATAVVPNASAASSFTDVNSNYTDAVQYLTANNIAKGISDTKFGTDASIKRGDAAVMIANALGLDVENAPISNFVDLNSRVAGAVNALHHADVINGKTATTFAPNDSITRAEMAKILAGAYKLDGQGVNNEFTDVNSNWDSYVDALLKNGITKGKTATEFGATANVTRGEFALFMYRAKDINSDVEEIFTEVSSIETATKLVDVNKEGQLLGFTVNQGKTMTFQQLSEAGYTVEFRSTTPAIFKDKKTGELNKATLAKLSTFNYQVVMTKGDVTIESPVATVKVEDFAKSVASLDGHTLSANGVNLVSQTLVLGETGSISNVKGTSWSGTELTFADNENLVFESSDSSKVLVNQSGVITTVSAGNAVITVTAKGSDVKMTIPVTVAAEARKADKVTADTTKVGLITGQAQEVALTVTDQYGDFFKNFTADDFAVKVDTKTIANVKVEADKALEGKYKATITATKQMGTGIVDIKKDNTTYLSLAITVGSNKEVASRKLELHNHKADTTLDLNPIQKDNAVAFVYNQYNADGILIGPETAIATKSKKYTVTTSNDNVTVSVTDGVITVTGAKAGTATITIKEGTIDRASATVTVQDTTPSIASVEFVATTVTKATATLSELLTAEGVKLTSTDKVSVDYNDGKAILFIETATVANGFTAGEDLLVGMVDAVSADLGAVTFTEEGLINIDAKALVAGNKGTFALRVLDTSNKVMGTSTITVDVK